MTPKLSIIVPVYNARTYLPQCVDSVLGQSFSELELILVDDGSADGSGALCDGYAAADGRVRVLHKPNGGVMAAVIDGIRAAAAPVVGFMDSDDWADRDYYRFLYERMTALEADMAVGEYVCQTDAGERPGTEREQERLYAGPEELDGLIRRFFTGGVTAEEARRAPVTNNRWDKLYRRDLLWENIPLFDTELTMSEDAVMNAAVLCSCRRVAALAHTPKYHYRQLPGSLSRADSPGRLLNVDLTHRHLCAIAQAKGLDRSLADFYAGSMIYGRAYQTAGRRDLSRRERTALLARITAQAPGALAVYARGRGGPVLRLFCLALDRGVFAPCVWLVRLNELLHPKKR